MAAAEWWCGVLSESPGVNPGSPGSACTALQPITKNTRVVSYEGERISHRESERREARQLPRGRIWCFTLDARTVVDASVGGNIARFINHACRPNCYVQILNGAIWIRAARNIRTGEELTYDYNTGGAAEIVCLCRPYCETVL